MKRLTEDTDWCLCGNLRKAARVITQLYDYAYRKDGLRATQVSVLVALHAAGPVRMNQLAHATATDRTTLTRTLSLLKKRGYVAMEHGTDRREHRVQLTPRGAETLTQILPTWKRAQESMIKSLGRARVERFLNDLKEVVRVHCE